MVVACNSNATPQRPDAPSALTATVEGNTVTLSWTAPASAAGCETYEFFVRDADGHLITDCSAFIGGGLDGVRKTNTFGNAGCNTTVRFAPRQSGQFTWGVQTVNAAYLGSTFATGDAFAFEYSSVETVGTDNAEELQHYNIMGQPVDAKEKGLHIVRMSNGKHTKQLVR